MMAVDSSLAPAIAKEKICFFATRLQPGIPCVESLMNMPQIASKSMLR